MVTFYRKAQINGSTLQGEPDKHLLTPTQPGQWNETEYLSMVSAVDDLPYVVVRPKINRKNNKKVLRMRSSWD